MANLQKSNAGNLTSNLNNSSLKKSASLHAERRTHMSDYANPDMLVSTNWVADHLSDPKVKVIEVDVDTTSYDKGHVKGAIGWNWQTDLNDRVRRDIVDPRAFAQLCSRYGVSPSDTVVF